MDITSLAPIAATFSAIASAISATIAYRASRSVVRADRSRRIRDLSLLANRVLATTVTADELANETKVAYNSLFGFASGGAGSSRHEMYLAAIEKKQTAIGPMQDAAR